MFDKAMKPSAAPLEDQGILLGPVDGDDGSGESIVVQPPVHGVWGDAGAPNGVGVFGASKFGSGVWGTTTDPAGTVVSGVAGVLGTGQVGVQGVSDAGTGVLGQSTGGGGVQGQSTTGSGVVGVSKTLNGVLGTSDMGVGVMGSSSGAGAGVFGTSLIGSGVFGGSSSGRGVSGSSIDGIGVSGVSLTSIGISGTSQTNAGVSGSSQTSTGVDGASESGIGVRAISGRNWGLYCHSSSRSDGVGIFAHCDPPGSAGLFFGDVFVSGNLTKGGGGFKIDHPQYPEEQFLNHSFVESSEMKNVYDGIVVLDARGEAVVEMPDWFEALNSEYRYLLTPIGGPGPGLYIASELAQGSFNIAGGRPGLKVSWQLTGVRRDAWAQQHRLPVEQAKSPAERGLLLHPAEAGKPHLLSIHGQLEQRETERQRSQ